MKSTFLDLDLSLAVALIKWKNEIDPNLTLRDFIQRVLQNKVDNISSESQDLSNKLEIIGAPQSIHHHQHEHDNKNEPPHANVVTEFKTGCYINKTLKDSELTSPLPPQVEENPHVSSYIGTIELDTTSGPSYGGLQSKADNNNKIPSVGLDKDISSSSNEKQREATDKFSETIIDRSDESRAEKRRKVDAKPVRIVHGSEKGNDTFRIKEINKKTVLKNVPPKPKRKNNDKLPSEKKCLPILSFLNVDITALELYDYIKISKPSLEILECLRIFMESDPNLINLNIIKILTFQIIKNININDPMDKLFECIDKILFRLTKNQFKNNNKTNNHDDIFFDLKLKVIIKIIQQLLQTKSSFDGYKIFISQIAFYLKMFIHLTVDDEELFSLKRHAYVHNYLLQRCKYPLLCRATIIRNFIKESTYSLKSLKILISSYFHIISKQKIDLDITIDDMETYKTIQTFIHSSLIIINDSHLLKQFKKTNFYWVEKSWNQDSIT